MIPLVATPISNPSQFLADRELIHITKSEWIPSIIDASNTSPLPHYASHNIALRAGQGWSFSSRIARDYSVLDPYLNNLKSYGCYTYFFLGQPGKWALLKNIGWSAMKGDMTGKATLHVKGQDLAKSAELVFHRIDDRVIVIRGDYVGPALVVDGGH